LDYKLIASEEINKTVYSTAILMSDKLVKLVYLNVNNDACTKRNQQYAKFPRRLPKIVPQCRYHRYDVT